MGRSSGTLSHLETLFDSNGIVDLATITENTDIITKETPIA